MTLEEYEVLIPPYHRYPRTEGAERSKFAEYVRLLLSQGVDFWLLLNSYLAEFELGRARGKQLDIIGSIVGAPRNLPYVVQGTNGTLDDDDYRMLIRARIAANTWDGTNEDLVRVLQTVFAGTGIRFTFTDDSVKSSNSAAMHMTYTIRGDFTNLQVNMIRGDLIVPRPAGVEVTYQIIDTTVDAGISTNTTLGAEFGEAGMKQSLS